MSEKKIENCKFSFKCPERWEDMEHTEESHIRHCHECKENVYLVETQEELNRNIELGLCTAIYEPEYEYATAGAVSIDSYTGEMKQYSIYLLPEAKLTIDQIKKLKEVLELEGNFLYIKEKYQSQAEVMLVRHAWEHVAEEIVKKLFEVGLACRLQELKFDEP